MRGDAPLEDVAGEVFNVGSNAQNYRIDELATVVVDAFPDASIEYHEERTDERSYRVEFEKIRSTLGYDPTEPSATTVSNWRGRSRTAYFQRTPRPDSTTA